MHDVLPDGARPLKGLAQAMEADVEIVAAAAGTVGRPQELDQLLPARRAAGVQDQVLKQCSTLLRAPTGDTLPLDRDLERSQRPDGDLSGPGAAIRGDIWLSGRERHLSSRLRVLLEPPGFPGATKADQLVRGLLQLIGQPKVLGTRHTEEARRLEGGCYLHLR